MNELLNIQFNFIDGSTQLNIDSCFANILINPMYCTEADISSEFLQQDSFAYSDLIRSKIFDGSLEIDNYLAMYNISTNLKPEHLFMIKRDYVICYCTYHIGNRLYLDYLSSSKKDKFLGDIKVSLEIKNDPTIINSKLDNAKNCIDSIISLFQNWHGSKSLANIFVKGELNSSTKTSNREWWWNQPGAPLAMSPIAATKYINQNTNTLQKISSVNVSYYEQFR